MRRRGLAPLAPALALGVALVLVPLDAVAATCSLSGGTLTITMAGDGDAATVSRSGSGFVVASVGIADPTCGGATMDM